MTNTVQKQDRRHDINNESGFSLAVTLFFAGAVAAILTALVYTTSQQATQGKASAAGWQIAEISRAARVFVRNQNANNVPGFTTADLATTGIGPREVSFAELKAAGVLANSYAEETPFGQTIRIIAANYPVRGNPADPETLPAAYIYVVDNDRSSSITSNIIAEGARRFGLSISSPRFDGAGNNVSADCGAPGDPSFAIWDTGCLNESDFNVLAGILPGEEQAFVAGSLLVPSWRSIQHDNRAVMRFPQQENTSFNQMQTDMAMGVVNRNPDGSCASFEQINTGEAALADTAVCDVSDDNTGGEQDRRFNIIGMGGLQAEHLIAANQSAGDASSDTDENIVSDNEVIIVSGPIRVGSENQVANIRVYDNSSALARPAGAVSKVNFTGADVTVARQVVMQSCNPVEEPDCTPATQFVADIDNLTANRVNVDTFNNDVNAAGTVFEVGDGTFNNSEALNSGEFNVLGNLSVAQTNASDTLPGRAHVISAIRMEMPAAMTVNTNNMYLQGQTTGLTNVLTTGANGGFGAVINSVNQPGGDLTVLRNVQATSRTDTRINIREITNIQNTLNIGVAFDAVTGECTGNCPVQDEPPLVLNP